MAAKLQPRDGLRTAAEEDLSASDFEAVLAALEDPDCRTLLEATTEDALTASELTDRCEIPRSTTYRKLEQLTEARLLTEQVRVSTDGKHASEYRRTVDNVTISLGEPDGITIGFSSTAATPEAAD